MKIQVVKSVAALLVLFFLISLMTVVSVADEELNGPQNRYTYIDSYSGSINHGLISSTCKSEVLGKSSVTKVKIKMELQKQTDGSYSTVETWEQTFSGRSGSMEESKITNPLSTYRLKATVTAYYGSNSESETFYRY